MKSAGNAVLKRSLDPSACGKPHWAKGILPESNQASMTSVTLRMVAPHFAQGSVTSSIQGLWTMRCSFRLGSACFAARKASNARGFSASISATEAGASWCSSSFSQTHTLRGVPQKRSRESAQSTLFWRKSPKRPSWMCSGNQRTARLFSMALSLFCRVRMYHAGARAG